MIFILIISLKTMASIPLITLSVSSLPPQIHCRTHPHFNNPEIPEQLSVMAAAASLATTTPTAATVVPAVIVGRGRVGRALQEMGSGQDLLVKKGDSVPLDFEGMILVCTRNDDPDAVLESTPKSRWKGNKTN